MKFKKSNKNTRMPLNQTGDGHHQNYINEPNLTVILLKQHKEQIVLAHYIKAGFSIIILLIQKIANTMNQCQRQIDILGFFWNHI